MIYLITIAVICLVVLAIQKLLPAKWQGQMKWVWLALFIMLTFNLLTNPYRLARLWQDLMQFMS
ncbi:MAG: hypothetical protein IKP23_04745 [Elusimicrobiaceae bacterium]|nr:hypothetical protein [Elusimicrobiaceae bacterium]